MNLTHRLFSLFLLILINIRPTFADTETSAMVNMLRDHPSPYLALHGDDPVKWQDWTQGVLDRAQAQGKLIYVSVGYFSCHWCHVMQKESFKNAAVAQRLNDRFVPVKVDRELNPALDAQLMEFAQQLQGRGGWPLNIYLTPEGHPLYAHLYTPRDNFEALLDRISTVWVEQESELRKVAKREAQRTLPVAEASFDVATIPSYLESFGTATQNMMDDLVGGFGNGPKFPSAPQLATLLTLQVEKPDSQQREFLALTFQSMANEGLRDHLDGGFFRYTVDPQWQTPHYEKMLYTNAMLVPLFLRAADVLEAPHYRQVARDTLDFMLRRMLGEDGAFVAAFSAVDNDGVEGGNYLWTLDAIQDILTEEEFTVAALAYGLTEDPAAENLLPRLRVTVADIAARTSTPPARITDLLASASKKLMAERDKRPLPVDDKYLAGWNGLTLSAFAQGAMALDEPAYRDASDRLATYLRERLWVNGQLLRAVDNKGQAIGQSSIQDYALVSAGLTDYLQLLNESAVKDERVSQTTEFVSSLIDNAWAQFFQNNGWQQVENDLIPVEGPRPVLLDSALPSSSSTLINATLTLAAKLDKPAWRTLALTALNQGSGFSTEFPFWTATQRSAMITLRDNESTLDDKPK